MVKLVGLSLELPRKSRSLSKRRGISISRSSDVEVQQGNPTAPFNRNQRSQQCQPQTSHEDDERWGNILHKYDQELAKGGIEREALGRDLWNTKSPADLLDQIHNSNSSDESDLSSWSKRLKSVLLCLDDLTTRTATVLFRGKVEVSTIIWGSINLILKFARSDLPRITTILEQLCPAIPRDTQQEEGLVWAKADKDLLCEIYTEIVVFLAKTISYFRNNPPLGKSGDFPIQFKSEISTRIANLHKLSNPIEGDWRTGGVTRESRSAEEKMVAEKQQNGTILDQYINIPYHMIPYGLNPQFICRSEEIVQVKNAFRHDNNKVKSQVVAIHGLGGVGKTQLALHYAHTSMRLYDIILWIPAGTKEIAKQALADFSKQVGLSLGDCANDSDQLAQKAKNWLNTSDRRFLLIFDNVDKLDPILPLWPSSEKGFIILTTRCPSVALKRSTRAIHLEAFTLEMGLEALISFTGMKPIDQEESRAARSIIELLGSLPLAIAQVADYIVDRGYSYVEFLWLYRRSPSQIHDRWDIVDYDYNISTVWDSSFQNLPKDARALQSLLCFFDPGGVAERLLTNSETELDGLDFGFLTDEIAFGDAVAALVRSSMIVRSPLAKAISTHRLVQSTVFSRLSRDQERLFLDSAIALLSNGFPNTSKASGDHQGHGWASWNLASEVLPHVNWLIYLTEEHELESSNPRVYAELVFRLGTYLWEKEQLTSAQRLFTFGFSLDIDPEGTVCNLALRIMGHIALDMARPKEALDTYNQTLNARLKLVGDEEDSPSIAEVYDSIACSYTEMGDITKAFEYIDKSIKIHERNNPRRMARTYSILSVTHLRAGKPDEALKALTECWRLQGLTEEEVADSWYPKHSGDIVLLARIQHAQGKKESALQLVFKSITIRSKILGNESPRVADSMYLAASMLEEDGKTAPAVKLLKEIVDMSGEFIDMRAQLGRALWTLARWKEMMGKTEEAEVLRGKAREIKRKILGVGGCEEGDEDDTFQQLVCYMLW